MPIMKKIIIIILVLLSVKDLRAQTVTTLIVNARPTDILSEWAYRKDIVSYIVQADSMDMQVKIKTEIKTVDGTTIAYTDLNRSNFGFYFDLHIHRICLNDITNDILTIRPFTQNIGGPGIYN